MPTPHSQDDIRSYTMQLSNMEMSAQSFHSTPPSMSTPSDGASPFFSSREPGISSVLSPSQPQSTRLSPTLSPPEVGSPAPRGSAARSPNHNPSALSILISSRRTEFDSMSPSSSTGKTPVPYTKIDQIQPAVENTTVDLTLPSAAAPPPKLMSVNRRMSEDYPREVNESSPLLGDVEAPGRFYTSSGEPNGNLSAQKPRFSMKRFASHVELYAMHLLATSVRSLPAVILGVLLNILDGISCMLFSIEST